MVDPQSWVEGYVDYLDKIRSREVASRFFTEFGKRFPKFEIRKGGHWEPLRDKFTVARAIDWWMQGTTDSEKISYCNLILRGSKPAPFYIFVDWYGKGCHPAFKDGLSIYVSRKWFKSVEQIEEFLQMFKFLLSFGRPFYGRMMTTEEQELKNWRTRILSDGSKSRESVSLLASEGLVDLYLANYFGRPYLTAFGKKPSDFCLYGNCEEFDDGVIVYLGQVPLATLEPDNRLYLTMRRSIGEEFFMDKAR